MAAVDDFTAGAYRFIPGGFQFSGGVAAMQGYDIKRFRFRSPVPLADGFARIEKTIMGAGRPLTAFCACELRSPGQFTEQGFRAFNEAYVVTLQKWGVFDGKVNPVARSNVCPEFEPPEEPSFHAFSFTVPTAATAPSFVISGRAEAREGDASYRERIVRFGETSAEAMNEKARYVMDEVAARLALFGVGWRDVTATWRKRSSAAKRVIRGVIQPSGRLATSEMPHPAAASTMRAATGLSASISRFPGRSLPAGLVPPRIAQ